MALPYLHLAASSTLIDKGVNVGLPYNGKAPDLGAFETGSTPTTTPPTTTPPTTTPPTTTPPTTARPTTAPPSTPAGSGCTATYQLAGAWSGGFQGGVTVANAGGSTVEGWTVHLTLPSGQTITQVWNASYTQSGSQVTATNVSCNGTLAPGTTTTFGFLANGDGSLPPTAISCIAS